MENEKFANAFAKGAGVEPEKQPTEGDKKIDNFYKEQVAEQQKDFRNDRNVEKARQFIQNNPQMSDQESYKKMLAGKKLQETPENIAKARDLRIDAERKQAIIDAEKSEKEGVADPYDKFLSFLNARGINEDQYNALELKVSKGQASQEEANQFDDLQRGYQKLMQGGKADKEINEEKQIYTQSTPNKIGSKVKNLIPSFANNPELQKWLGDKIVNLSDDEIKQYAAQDSNFNSFATKFKLFED